jgi:PKHD-type hydroxylase
MKLKWEYWYFNKVLSKKFCDKVIKEGLKRKKEKAIIGKHASSKSMSKKELKTLKSIRDSDVVWMNDQWLYDEIHPYINKANQQAEWNFQTDWCESFQFTLYKKNQFYDWHQDCFDEPFTSGNENKIGKIRKLSATILLNSPKQFSGGELEFSFIKNPSESEIIKCKEITEPGSIIVFPSHQWHRVAPIIKGTRYSLVLWCLGAPFK